jgi:arabinosyltransferase
MRRLEERLSRQKYWDQTAYNEELFFLSHGDYVSPQATVRVMDIYRFMNSKVLFKDVRTRPREERLRLFAASLGGGKDGGGGAGAGGGEEGGSSSDKGGPCMVHINYHPDKHARMQAVFRYFVDGDEHALDGFPGGSEPGT